MPIGYHGTIYFAIIYDAAYSKTVTAKFGPVLGISVSISPDGSGTVKENVADNPRINCPGDCEETLGYQQQITLTATPNTGYAFVKWTSGGNDYSTNPTETFTITDAMNITAVFEQVYTLTVLPDPPGGGTITSSVGGINCGNGNVACVQTMANGIPVTLTITPNIGYEVDNWNDGTNSDSTYSLVEPMDHITQVAVKFKKTSARQPGYVGLFIGIRDNDPYDIYGATDAANVSAAFNNLPNVAYNRVLTGDNVNPSGTKLTVNDVLNAIAEAKSMLQPGDTLVIHFAAHGLTDTSQSDETTASPGDEAIKIGPNKSSLTDVMTDDQLTLTLKPQDETDVINGVTKIVILDTCYSGGFWGNNNPADEGDLEKLNNIALIAGSSETEDALTVHADNTGLLSDAVVASLQGNARRIISVDDLWSGVYAYELNNYNACIAHGGPSCPQRPDYFEFHEQLGN